MRFHECPNPWGEVPRFYVGRIYDVSGGNPILKAFRKEEQHVGAVLPCHETTTPELLGDFMQCH